jgi:hypothetical protein
VAFFLKLLGTKNSIIFAINHPTCKNKTEAKKFSFLQNSTNAVSSLQQDIEVNQYCASIIACGMGNAKNESMNPKEVSKGDGRWQTKERFVSAFIKNWIRVSTAEEPRRSARRTNRPWDGILTIPSKRSQGGCAT